MSDKRKELADTPSVQIDTDANATCKKGTGHFGYNSPIGMDASRAGIIGYQITRIETIRWAKKEHKLIPADPT